MGRTWSLALVAAVVVACGPKRATVAPSPPPPPPREGVPTASSVPVSSLIVTIPGAPTAFRLHAGEFANLFYQLDCLARTTRCSRAAYEDLWSRTLGGLDEGDREALTRWKKLRERYGGRIERHDDSHDLVLPVHRPGRQISSRLRLAGYSADSAAHYSEHLSLFADPADVAEAVSIVGRFAPRFGTWWPTQRAPLARSIDAYAKLFARPDVQATLVEVAQFYRPVFPKGHVMDIDLIARPSHDSSTSGELVGMHSLVEVVDGEPAEGRFSVILHEIFHGWFSSAGDKALVDLAARFAASSDIDAAAAYSLLDEGLATANGNGKIARLVNPDDYARRIAQPRGLYNDTLVDGMAKAELAAMDRHAAGTASVFEEGFVAQYLSAFHGAFPVGVPPIGRLHSFVLLYDKSMRGAYDHLFEIAHPSNLVSDDTLDVKAASDTLEHRGRWPLVLMVPFSKLDLLRAWSTEIDAPTARTIAERARAGKPFIVASRRRPRLDLFVLVAADEPAMIALVDALAARETPFDALVPGDTK